jgi:glycosyltransferase involved in cell wall biosynthesis
MGGAERVLLALHKLHPEAPVYTSLYDRGACGQAFAGIDVRTTWLQRVPLAGRYFRAMLPLYPRAFEALNLAAYQIVISSSTSFAKGVRTPSATMHVCYMNTPTRFLWYPQEYVRETTPLPARALLNAIAPALRRWDVAAAQRPFRIVANSHNVAQRIREVYGRASDVVPCPVDLQAFGPPQAAGEYYLVASRLLRYKRVALAIQACNALSLPLVIAGSGPDERRLRRIAGKTVSFAGNVDDAQRRRLFARARALIVPGSEDFGLVPLEAAASGRPSVAFRAGGALETVVEGKTGIFFDAPSADSLGQALRRLEPWRYDPAVLRAHAERFSAERFREQMRSLLEGYWHAYHLTRTRDQMPANAQRPATIGA